MFSGIPSDLSAKVRNADGTTGRLGAGASLSVALATEDQGTLIAIKADLDKFAFVGDRLKVDAQLDASSITIGTIKLQDGTGAALGVVRSDGVENALIVHQNSQPLPTGAATEATLSTAQGNLASILAAMATAANQGTEIGHLVAIDTNLSALNAKFSAIGQHASVASLSVVVASDQIVPISASSLPLPTGASTEATLSALNTKFTTTGSGLRVDGSAVTQPVSAASLPLPTGAATSANQASQITSLTSIDGKLTTTANGLKVDGSGVTQPVSATALPLPAGASTAAAQATAGASLASIDGKLPSIGQHTMAASLGVVIASDQGPVPISAASLPLPAGASTAANQTTANTSLSSLDGKTATLGQKVMIGSSPVVIASDQSAVPISAASLPLPTGAATAANQATANASLSSIDGKLTTTANGLKVDGSAVTQPMSAASLPLPTGASTAANQATANASLTSIDGKLASLGQKTMSGSTPVVISSDQSPLSPASDFSGTGTIVALNGAVSLSVHGAASALVTLSGTWVASVQVQGLAPDGSTWITLATVAIPGTTGTFSTSAISANGTYRLVTAAAYSSLRVVATAYTSGTITVNIASSSAPGLFAPVQLNAANLQTTSVPVDGAKATYSATINGLATALLATDIFTITGSATKTVRVTKVEISGIAGSNSNSAFVLLKRSTANTAGTSAAVTAVPHDSTAAAATATVLSYTANPTTGTLVGNITSARIPLAATNAAAGVQVTAMLDSHRPSQALVLRGIAEVMAVNLAGATVAGSSLNISIEWTEE